MSSSTNSITKLRPKFLSRTMDLLLEYSVDEDDEKSFTTLSSSVYADDSVHPRMYTQYVAKHNSSRKLDTVRSSEGGDNDTAVNVQSNDEETSSAQKEFFKELDIDESSTSLMEEANIEVPIEESKVKRNRKMIKVRTFRLETSSGDKEEQQEMHSETESYPEKVENDPSDVQEERDAHQSDVVQEERDAHLADVVQDEWDIDHRVDAQEERDAHQSDVVQEERDAHLADVVQDERDIDHRVDAQEERDTTYQFDDQESPIITKKRPKIIEGVKSSLRKITKRVGTTPAAAGENGQQHEPSNFEDDSGRNDNLEQQPFDEAQEDSDNSVHHQIENQETRKIIKGVQSSLRKITGKKGQQEESALEDNSGKAEVERQRPQRLSYNHGGDGVQEEADNTEHHDQTDRKEAPKIMKGVKSSIRKITKLVRIPPTGEKEKQQESDCAIKEKDDDGKDVVPQQQQTLSGNHMVDEVQEEAGNVAHHRTDNQESRKKLMKSIVKKSYKKVKKLVRTTLKPSNRQQQKSVGSEISMDTESLISWYDAKEDSSCDDVQEEKLGFDFTAIGCHDGSFEVGIADTTSNPGPHERKKDSSFLPLADSVTNDECEGKEKEGSLSHNGASSNAERGFKEEDNDDSHSHNGNRNDHTASMRRIVETSSFQRENAAGVTSLQVAGDSEVELVMSTEESTSSDIVGSSDIEQQDATSQEERETCIEGVEADPNNSAQDSPTMKQHSIFLQHSVARQRSTSTQDSRPSISDTSDTSDGCGVEHELNNNITISRALVATEKQPSLEMSRTISAQDWMAQVEIDSEAAAASKDLAIIPSSPTGIIPSMEVCMAFVRGSVSESSTEDEEPNQDKEDDSVVLLQHTPSESDQKSHEDGIEFTESQTRSSQFFDAKETEMTTKPRATKKKKRNSLAKMFKRPGTSRKLKANALSEIKEDVQSEDNEQVLVKDKERRGIEIRSLFNPTATEDVSSEGSDSTANEREQSFNGSRDGDSTTGVSTNAGSISTAADKDVILDDIYHAMGTWVGGLYEGLGRAADMYTETSMNVYDAIHSGGRDRTYSDSEMSDEQYTLDESSSEETEDTSPVNADEIERLTREVMVKILKEREDVIQTQALEIGRLRERQEMQQQQQQQQKQPQQHQQEMIHTNNTQSPSGKRRFAKPLKALSSVFANKRKDNETYSDGDVAYSTTPLDSRNDNLGGSSDGGEVPTTAEVSVQRQQEEDERI